MTPAEESELYHRALESLHLLRVRARFLPVKHPSVEEAIDQFRGYAMRAAQSRGGLTIIVVAGEFFVNGSRFPTESILYEDTIKALSELGITSLYFGAGLGHEELATFVSAWFVPQGEAGRSTPLTHIELNQHDLALEGGGGGGDTGMDIPIPAEMARENYRAAIGAVVGAFYDSKSRSMLNINLVESMVNSLHQGVQVHPELYLMVSQLREFSEYTFFHSVNVAILSMLLGARVGLDNEQVRRLGMAAMLHDVGKANVPPEILNKPGRLDEKERAVMEKHPADSVKILSEQPSAHPSALAVAAQHHVGFDQKGYPNFAGYDDLHLFSHIVTIADVYDALRSERSYKRSMLPDRAMLIMLEGSGKTFHPTLLKAFFRMVGPFPPGTLVELDSGEIAVVSNANSKDPFHPRLKLYCPYEGRGGVFKPMEFDEEEEGFSRSIVRAIDPAPYGIQPARVV